MLLQVELQERKSAIYRSFLERESVASVVGALLLLGLGAALIVAMFTHTVTTEVVTNSFLLVLGYFFGQATTRGFRGGGVDRADGQGEQPDRPQKL